MAGRRERRRPGHFRICGACGKRNKARRSECTRCGAPLRGIPEAIPGSVRSAAPAPPSDARPARLRWLVPAGIAVAILAGFGMQRLFRGGRLAPAGQSLAVPDAAPETLPAAPPSSTAEAPSADAYREARANADRGEKLLARGDARGAASLLAEASRLAPDDARVANLYGRALAGIGSADRALRQYEKAARLNSGVAAYRLDFARALAEAGRKGEAAREYQAVEAMEPGNAAAAEALAGMQGQPGAPPAEGGSVDLGGAAPSGGASARPAGGVFTNDDLQRGARPAARPAASPSIPSSLRSSPPPVYLPASPLPSPSPE